MKDSLGNRVRLFREGKGLTQANMAKILGCTVTTVSKLENNHHIPMTVRKAFSSAFNQDIFLLPASTNVHKEEIKCK